METSVVALPLRLFGISATAVLRVILLEPSIAERVGNYRALAERCIVADEDVRCGFSCYEEFSGAV